MKNEVLIIEAPELAGVEKSKAKQIKETFEPMVKMLAEFDQYYEEVIAEAEEGIDLNVSSKAKRLRLDIGKIRIEAERVRKEQKEEYVLAGKAIDGVNNILKWAISEKETKLKEIENHAEIEEEKRLSELQAERVNKLSPYVVDCEFMKLAEMDDDVWKIYLAGKIQEDKDLKAAQKIAEEKIIEKVKAEKEEQKRIKAENEQLLKEAEASEKQAKKEAEERAKIEAERLAKEAKEEEARLKAEAERAKREAAAQKERDEKARKEREAHEAQIEEQRKLNAEIERKAREAKEVLEAQLQERKDAEIKALKEEEDRVQSELKKGDVDKVKDLINDLAALKTKYTFKSKANKLKFNQVGQLIDKVINHIKK